MSCFFAMLHAKNYYIRPMFHGVIHKITLAQFFLRHGVDGSNNVRLCQKESDNQRQSALQGRELDR